MHARTHIHTQLEALFGIHHPVAMLMVPTWPHVLLQSEQALISVQHWNGVYFLYLLGWFPSCLTNV